MSLRDVIQDYLQQARGEMSASDFQEMQATVLRMAEAAVAAQALRPGDRASNFALPNTRGERVTLDALLGKGPVVLSFYRGGWCAFCNMELDALQQVLPEITQRGAALVAIAPESPEHARATAETQHLGFDVLSDPGNAVAKHYGLAFALDEETRAFHERQNVDLRTINGNDDWELPVPGTYVIDRDGTIAWSFIDGNFTERAEPMDVIAALDRLALAKQPSELEET